MHYHLPTVVISVSGVSAVMRHFSSRLPQRPAKLIVCGGGRKNPAIIEALRSRAQVEPVLTESVGWRGDAVEAECFAYLAVHASRSLPISFPLTTGVTRPMSGGRLAVPPHGR